jgi:SAM-dependent methyltransferase
VTPRIINGLVLALFASAIFVSAFLLFQVQPIMAKFILPWFGGSPGVWTTCMLVFQVLLFAGYAYAHLLQRGLSLRGQVLMHGILLGLAAAALPITPSPDWKPSSDSSPSGLIIALLLAKIGLPYFVLSSTGPLLQSWLGQANACTHPHRLYALSNVGSLLALLSFPFVVEPALSSQQQAATWSLLFMGFIGLCIGSGIAAAWLRRRVVTTSNTDVPPPGIAVLVTPSVVGVWFALSLLPSILLLATTNQICLDVGVIPFLWVVPLAVYLMSFILTFESDRWYERRTGVLLAMISFLALFSLKALAIKLPLLVELGLHFAGLFFSCMVCHGELVKLRPSSNQLTFFYLVLSAGGACGGLFVGLVAPIVFNAYHEWQLALFGCILVFMETYLQRSKGWLLRIPTSVKWSLAVGLPIVAVCWMSFWNSRSNNQLIAMRNFYGVLSVTQAKDEVSGRPIRNLVHGRVVHGSQFLEPELAGEPTTYYAPQSGVGLTLLHHQADRNRKIGVVGLGAGTLATYGLSGDVFRFYEINPHVIQLAKEYFSFLSSSDATIETVLGDARLTLERESPQDFDVLVLDAFSGDAIPVHLLTREAMKIYTRHLRHDGILAIHISNLYFDLESIVAGLATCDTFEATVVDIDDHTSAGALTSKWVLLSRQRDSLNQILQDTPSTAPVGKPVLWTDDKNDLLKALK